MFMTVIERTARTAPPPRKAGREVRRDQLIEATIAALARKGFATLTIADVAKEAGLSPGIIIFHFSSKDDLLAAVLGSLANEYHQNWVNRVKEAGPSPAERMKAMLLADFDTTVFTHEKLAAWIAFWGETQGRPVYDEIYGSLDAERRAASAALCRELIVEGGYALDPHLAMCALEALGDGLWLGLAAQGASLRTGEQALEPGKVIMATLRSMFPKHFPPGI